MKRRSCCAGAGVLHYPPLLSRKTIARFCLMGGSAAGGVLHYPRLLGRKTNAAKLLDSRLTIRNFREATGFQILPERWMNGGSAPAKNTQIFSLTLNAAGRLLSPLAGRDNFRGDVRNVPHTDYRRLDGRLAGRDRDGAAGQCSAGRSFRQRPQRAGL